MRVEKVGLSPDDPAAPRQLALIYYDQAQLPQAYELLKRAAELRPDDLELLLDVGQTSLTVGDLQRAHDAAVAVLDKRLGDEQALVILASATTPDDAEDTRKFIEELRARIRTAPDIT